MIRPWRIATFNLESFGGTGTALEDPDARIRAMRPLLEELAADILCLQEVNAQRAGSHGTRHFAALGELIRRTPYEAYHRATSVDAGTGRPADVHNLVILSRWPIARHWQVCHDIVPPPRIALATRPGEIEVRWDRPALFASIETPFGLVHVANLHLRAPRAAPFAHEGFGGHWAGNAQWAEGFHIAALKRQGQALETRLAIDRIFATDAKALVAVCGDFNADSFETPLRILRGAPDEGATDALEARILNALDMRISAGERFSVIHNGRRIMLDHILASPALSEVCESVRAYNAGLADEALAHERTAGSFHAAVAAQFRAG